MALSVGTRLGPYEIVAPIGAGGMGEVYKAKDTRLERIVAIKVLPEDFAEVPERKQRFEREAKAISKLNHPHICILHDIGSQDGVEYLVMEFIEGETLAAKLEKGALPLDQALEYGIQIADGLDTAHRAGITHRDLKPPNVMLTPSGIKILDFGLAKLVAHNGSDSAASDAPTRQQNLTKEHSIIGTLQYMAPEQLEGKTVDARADVWAFGALVYEMLTGRKAFNGETQASLIAAIMEHDPPPVSERQSLSPAALDRSVTRCLAKSPEDRWQSARDLREELRWIARGAVVASVTARSRSRPRGLVTAAIGVALVAVLAWVALRAPDTEAPRLARASIRFPENQHIAIMDARASSPVALSPDGSFLVYSAVSDGALQLFKRAVSAFEAAPIPGTEGASGPFFSPDGQWLGFVAEGKLQKVALGGGLPIVIAEVPVMRGASWGGDGYIVFADDRSNGLMRVSEDGGATEVLTTPSSDDGETSHRLPHHLPGGRDLLFSARARDGSTIAILSLASGRWRSLGVNGSDARYADTGSSTQLLFQRSGDLFAVPFSPARGEVAGTPIPILTDIMVTASTQSAYLSISDNGLLVYVPSAGGAELARLDREGNATRLMRLESGSFQWPRVSPDGSLLAVCQSADGDWGVWVFDLERGTRTLFSRGIAPVWSPDSDRLVVTDTGTMYWGAADGSDELEILLDREHESYPGSFHPEDGVLAFYEVHPSTRRDLYLLEPGNDGAAKPFLVSSDDERRPMFSPDGRFIAYQSDETGRDEVYVRPYPGAGRKWIVSTDGGELPRWSATTSELFYWSGDRLMAVSVATEPEFTLGTPKPLFSVLMYANAFYDVAPDGQSFYVVQRDAATRELRVVFNWFEELDLLTAN